jgi:hypothetical protein
MKASAILAELQRRDAEDEDAAYGRVLQALAGLRGEDRTCYRPGGVRAGGPVERRVFDFRVPASAFEYPTGTP